jgi:glycosyltransferase involved in cell wall biosynthesis
MDRRIAVEFREWSQAREVEDLRSMDSGVYPLPDDPWTLGKCGFKAIQYMACGIPLVASPVGVLRQMVGHGETGFHAARADDWVRGITRLLEAPSRRAEMGRRGRERAEQSYSVDSVLPRLISLLQAANR